MKVYRKVFFKEKKCSTCGWEAHRGFIIARNEEEANKKFKNDEWMCDSCMIDEIVNENYVVCKGLAEECFPNIIFPFPIYKHILELYLGRKVSQEEFEKFEEFFLNETTDELFRKFREKASEFFEL